MVIVGNTSHVFVLKWEITLVIASLYSKSFYTMFPFQKYYAPKVGDSGTHQGTSSHGISKWI